MGKSLREALAEQMAALRAHGLAPETPPEGEEPEMVLPTNGHEPERARHLGKRAAARRQPRPATARMKPATTAAEQAQPKGTPRPPSIGKLLERRAEQRRHEQQIRDEVRQELASVRGGVADEPTMSAFLKALEQETGALPPLHVVLEAIRQAQSDNPEAVADAVRRYYRRPRRVAR